MSDEKHLTFKAVRPVQRADRLPLLRTHVNARMPEQRAGDVGFDIFCVDDVILPAGKVTLINIGWRLADFLPDMHIPLSDGKERHIAVSFLKVEGRSSLASRGVFPVGGIIDPAYRGEIGALLFNSSGADYRFDAGDKVAQLVCYYTLANAEGEHLVRFVEVDQLTETERGAGGFGSTGR